MYHPFSVSDTIKTAWFLVKRNFAMVFIFSLIGFIILIAELTIIRFFLPETLLYLIAGAIVFLITLSFVILGFIKLIFQLIDREYYDFDFSDIVPKFKMIFSYLLLFTLVFTISFALNKSIETLNE